MPDNWRDLLLDELADWEEQGVLVPSESLPVLERWIVKLARHRGTLPVDDPGSESGALTDRFENLVVANRSAVAIVAGGEAELNRSRGQPSFICYDLFRAGKWLHHPAFPKSHKQPI